MLAVSIDAVSIWRTNCGSKPLFLGLRCRVIHS